MHKNPLPEGDLGMPPADRATADGTHFPCVSAGEGSTVVFLHGAWADHRIWCGLWQRVAERHRFFAYTQRHFGRAVWPADKPFARDVHAADLQSILRQLAAPVHLVGWSYAGDILMQAATALPERVRSLVLYEPSLGSLLHCDAGGRETLDAFWRGLEPAYALAQAGDLVAAMRQGIAFVFGLPQDEFAALDPRCQRVFLDNAHTILPDLAAPAPSLYGLSEVAKLHCPVLLVRGELTHAQYRLMTERIVGCLPQACLAEIPGTGHGGPVQMPDAFVELALDFIAGCGGRCPRDTG